MKRAPTGKEVWDAFVEEERRQGGRSVASPDEVAEVVAYLLDMSAKDVKSAVLDFMSEDIAA